MDSLEHIIKNITAPLLFLAKDSYRNISLVKNLEASMTAQLNKLAHTAALPTDNELHREEFGTILAGLARTFLHFDDLPANDKKTRVAAAFELLSRLCDLAGTPSPAPPAACTPITPKDARLCLERLACPVRELKGVGPRVTQLFSKKNVITVEDLLYFLPRKYEDRRSVKTIADTIVGTRETTVGRVVQAKIQQYRTTRIFEVTFDDGSGTLTAKWFKGNFAYLKKTFTKGMQFILTGEVRNYLFGKDMIHPDYEKLDDRDDALLHFKRIVPIYSETTGLRQKYIRKIMMRAIEGFSSYMTSPIPAAICRRHGLADIDFSVCNVHFPTPDQDVQVYNDLKSAAHKRLIFDEFFFFELGMALKKKGYVLDEGIRFDRDGSLVKKFLDTLPFVLTEAQKRVSKEIEEDMAECFPMHRLLQGDVGSGKTVVSMIAMLRACENGCQSVIMAPTEILAAQHYSNIRHWAASLGLSVALLTGSTKAAERARTITSIETGTVHIIVGTHALIQEGVQFKKLGFVVIDEQHRFGVVQRAALRAKGVNPDVLVMTATPIPRTLAMTVYGDLDLSVIDELPPGKKPTTTKVFFEQHRPKVYEIIRQELTLGHQVFIVYPLVEESENLDLKDATTMSRHLQDDIFPEFKVGLIHGKMKSDEKNRIMQDFKKGNLNILVSTTVIEVGIDIPTASLMVIEHAERFGLSQLHQLRGRVGRSDLPSSCVLVTNHIGSADAGRRLRVMEKTNDGFTIAEEDLAIRGPGEFMGIRQSGLPDFRVANIIRDAAILNDARKEAFRLVQGDPTLEKPEHKDLSLVLEKRWKGKLELAKTG